MEAKSAEAKINAYEKALENSTIELKNLKQKSFEQANEIASLKIELEELNNQLYQSHLNTRSIESQLNIAKDKAKQLKEESEISDMKI